MSSLSEGTILTRIRELSDTDNGSAMSPVGPRDLKIIAYSLENNIIRTLNTVQVCI